MTKEEKNREKIIKFLFEEVGEVQKVPTSQRECGINQERDRVRGIINQIIIKKI